MRILWAIVFMSIAVSAGLMTPLAAGVFCNGFCPGPCTTCRPVSMPMPCNTCHANPCGCAPVIPAVPQTVIQQRTIMQPQQVAVPQTTYRDVVRTEFRTQAELQQVPVTRYRQVTVDEGQWQQVWVPRQVVKQVPETVLEQRTAYRSVPYQVTQRVPETVMTTQTQWVPRVVSEQVPVRSACNPYGGGFTAAPAIGSTYLPSLASSPVYAPIASSYGPMIGAIPNYSTSPVTLGRELQPLNSVSSLPSENLTPVPDPRHLDTPRTSYSDWSDVPSRTSSREPVRTSSSSSGLFVPAGTRRR